MKRLATTLVALTALCNVALAASTPVEVLEETSEYRVVQHMFGETRIPANPKRIVSLTTAPVEAMLEFGLGKPVGVPFYWAGKHPSYLEDDLAGVPTLGNDEYTLNLEAILAQQPDLILTYAYGGVMNSNLTYEQVSQIAPTVVFDWTHLYSDFRTGYRELGAVLGVAEEVEARLEAYEETLAEVRATFTETLSGATLAYVTVYGKDIGLRGRNSVKGAFAYGDLGFEVPELIQEMGDEEYRTISLEVLPRLADVDFILLEADTEQESKATLRTLQASSLWRSLPAAEQNQVFPITTDILNNTVRSNELLMDELLTLFIGQTN
jgi:iron complex transport system substrate-binding protein